MAALSVSRTFSTAHVLSRPSALPEKLLQLIVAAAGLESPQQTTITTFKTPHP
jgi:hypothetical protein